VADLLDVLDQHFGHPRVDRRGERWTLCPFHGDRRIGSFSYGERGFRCFACGESGGLGRLADQGGLHSNAPVVVMRPAPRPRIVHDWQRDPDYWRRYLSIPDAARRYYHKRGFTDETIQARGLGYGVLPASRCRLPRLILPVFEGGACVALRGRAFLPSDGDDKWLCAGGSQTVLYGRDSLHAARPVVITEAPYSAILCRQARPDIAAVAGTSGAATWRDDWTRQIAESLPPWALVWYDNDEAGRVNGPKIAAALQRVGVTTHVHQWPDGTPEHRDLADVLAEGGDIPIPVVRPRVAALAGVLNGYW
jgi:hypothetical protein